MWGCPAEVGLNVVLQTIPHRDQRYPTVGDWTWDRDTLTIRVSDLGDWRYEFLVGLHELVEAALCRHRGIPQEAVDAFDMAFEGARPEGDASEPGFASDAPYRQQHTAATGIETLLASLLEVDWNDYVQRLFDSK